MYPNNMVPHVKDEYNPFKTNMKTVTFKGFLMKTPNMWLANKRLIDHAEGLWRVHDGLYDVSDFIQSHPGGQFWLESTKGTDITEAFESHHVTSTMPENTLKQYYIRDAKLPRQSPFTFEDHGFYKTLKRNVREAIKSIPTKDSTISNTYTDCLVAAMLIFAIFANIFWSFKLAVLSGIFCGLTVCAGHNYCHKRDNFRMHYIDLSTVSCRDFRTIHVLSHHFQPNTVTDTQVYFSEPFIAHFPEKKSFVVKYGSWIYGPLLFWTLAFLISNILNILGWIFNGRTHKLGIHDFLPLVVPLTMQLFGDQPFIATLGLWQFIIAVGSFTFCIVAFTNSHIHPDIYMEGDTPRPKEEMDWGINQLDTISDRHEVTGNKFLVLVSFGDHALHHLFPTLDHSILHYLYPVVQDTMKKFNVDVRMISQMDMFTGYFKQLARERRNPNPPNLLKTLHFRDTIFD